MLYSRSGQSHVAKYILAGRLPFWVKQGVIQEAYFIRGKSQCSGGQDGGNGQPKNKSQPFKKNHVVGSQTGGKSQCSTSEPKSQCAKSEPKSQCSKSEPKSQCSKSEPKSQCSKPVAKLQGSKHLAEPQCLPPQTIPGAPTFTKFSPGAKPQSDIPVAPMVKSCGKRVPAGVKATYRGKECFKPQAIQKLVPNTRQDNACAKTSSSEPLFYQSRIAPIRVCTPEDMKRLCPPEPCKCPDRVEISALQVAGKGIWFLMKAAMAGGLLYFTVTQGLWQDQEETTDLYVRMHESALIIFKGIKPTEDAEIPKREKVFYCLKDGWNKGVKGVFSFLVNLPSSVANLPSRISKFRQKSWATFTGQKEAESKPDGITE
uniref:MICOS complex subunit MIC13 n=1 Tax=Timema californicum TaxID=61474 RepID=A0A7R9P8Z3_TIMCA|nr:unnamed protein product [Timema californicum]